MAEYIKRVDAMKICQQYSQQCFNANDSKGQFIAETIEDEVIKIPTANVIEVIRCKDCNYHKTDAFGQKMCMRGFTYFQMNDDDYCSYGVRKGDNK